MIGSAGSWSSDHLSAHILFHSVFMATPSRIQNSISQGPFCTIFLKSFFFLFFLSVPFVSSRAMSSLEKREIKKKEGQRKGDETSKYWLIYRWREMNHTAFKWKVKIEKKGNQEIHLHFIFDLSNGR